MIEFILNLISVSFGICDKKISKFRLFLYFSLIVFVLMILGVLYEIIIKDAIFKEIIFRYTIIFIIILPLIYLIIHISYILYFGKNKD